MSKKAKRKSVLDSDLEHVERFSKAEKQLRSEMAQRERDISSMRYGIHEWWFQTRDMLTKIRQSAQKMVDEIEAAPDGILAAVVQRGQVGSIEDAMRNALELLHEMDVTGSAIVHAPSDRMFRTRDNPELIPAAKQSA